MGQALVLDEAVLARQADGALVEAHRVQIASFEARCLGANQRRAIAEVLRAVVSPYFELALVSGQGFQMLPARVGQCGIAEGRVAKRTVEVILRRFKNQLVMSKSSSWALNDASTAEA